MYKFKQIKAKYNFTSEVIQPSGISCVYTKTEPVTVLPNLVEGLNFTLHGAMEEKINNAPLKDFDLIMSRLGHCLYPIELNVLKTGRLKRIKNFTEIQKRWHEEGKKILSTYCNNEKTIKNCEKQIQNNKQQIDEIEYLNSIPYMEFIKCSTDNLMDYGNQNEKNNFYYWQCQIMQKDAIKYHYATENATK